MGWGDYVTDPQVLGYLLGALVVVGWVALQVPRRVRYARVRREKAAAAATRPLPPVSPDVGIARPARAHLHPVRRADVRLAEGPRSTAGAATSSLADDLRSHLVRDVVRRRN